MNLYLLSQDKNSGCNTFDSAVVCALGENDARQIHPEGTCQWGSRWSTAWCETPSQVTVRLIGVAAPSVQHGVVLSSFNAA